MIINDFGYEYELARQLEALKLSIQARPLVLGGTSSYSGGIGGPTGGFVGYLPQGLVAGDYSEAEDNTLPVSGATLLDNLNRIRYRISQLEDGSNIIVEENGTVVASGVVVLNFVGADIEVIPSGVIITLSGSGSGAGISDQILLYHAGAVVEYTPDSSGLTLALSNSVSDDIVLLPPNTTISGNFTLPAGVTLMGGLNKTSRINGTITMSKNESGYSSRVENLILYPDTNNYSLKLACADTYQTYGEYIVNCDFILDDENKFCVDATYETGDYVDYFFIDCLFGKEQDTWAWSAVGTAFKADTDYYIEPFLYNCVLGGAVQLDNCPTGDFYGIDSGTRLPTYMENYKRNQSSLTIEHPVISGTDTRNYLSLTRQYTSYAKIKAGGIIETVGGMVLGYTSTSFTTIPNSGELWFREKTITPEGTSSYIKLINVNNILYAIDETGNIYKLTQVGLDDIDGITITAPTSGQVLGYDGSIWSNTSIIGSGLGDVVGPASATDGHLAVFDGTTGKLIKDGGAVPSGGYTQGARVYHNADQNISHSTNTTLAFNSERYDTDVIHDTVTNNSRLTCKTAGKYLITVDVQFAAASGGIRQIWMLLNGATIIAFSNMVEPGGGFNARINLSTIYDLAVNDYVECVVYQNSGGTIVVSSAGNYSPEFMMQRIG